MGRLRLTLLVVACCAAPAAAGGPGGLPAGAQPTMRVSAPTAIVAPGLVRIRVVTGNSGRTAYRSATRITLPVGLELDTRVDDHPAVVRARAALERAQVAHRSRRSPATATALAAARADHRLASTGASVRIDVVAESGRATIHATPELRRPRRDHTEVYRLRVAGSVTRRISIRFAQAVRGGNDILTLPIVLPVTAP